MTQKSKWPTIGLWAGIVLVAGFVIKEITLLMEPTDFRLINVEQTATNALWIVLGLFFVYNFFKGKKTEEATSSVEDNTDENGALRTRRNWIVALLLSFTLLGSLEMWILNDYSAGLTPDNILSIFDVLANIFFAFVIIQIFRNRDIPSSFFSVVAMYVIGLVILDVWRGAPWNVIPTLLFGAYLAYSIKVPLTAHSFRVANLILLPAFVVGALGVSAYVEGQFNQLWKQEFQQEQAFSTTQQEMTSAFQVFMQKDSPTRLDIENIERVLASRNEKLKNLLTTLVELKAEYEDLPASENKILFLDQINKLEKLLDLYEQQGSRIIVVTQYAKELDFKNVSESQRENLAELIKKVLELDESINELALEL